MKKLFYYFVFFILLLSIPSVTSAARATISIKTSTSIVEYARNITISGHVMPRKKNRRVYLYSSPIDSIDYHLVKSTRTDSRGYYRFRTKITKPIKLKTQTRVYKRKYHSVPKKIIFGEDLINQFYIAQFTTLLNQERANNNLKPMINVPAKNQGALAKVQHMIDNDYFAHCWNGICDSNFYSYSCSCLGMGYGTPTSMLDGWLTSPYGHRGCVLIRDWEGYQLEFGVAYKRGYWAFFPKYEVIQN